MRSLGAFRSLGIAFLWALFVHLTLSRLLIDDSVINFVLRTLAIYFLLNRLVKEPTTFFYVGLFLVPVLALSLNDYFLLVLPRAAVVAYVLMLFSWRNEKLTWSEVAEALLLGLWGLWLCQVLVDPGALYSGWFKARLHLDYVPLMSDDGQNYIELGQNLIKMATTMYRPPGFPLLTRSILSLLAPNLHLLLVFNVLVLMTTFHLLLRFACPKPSWIRVVLFVPLAIYFNARRIGSYQSIVTDPLNDVLMIGHLIFLYRYLVEGEIRSLKNAYLTMLAAFFVRPTILYYAFTLTAALAGRAVWQKQTARPILRNFAIFILLPLLLLIGRNRLLHGVFAYSSMQGQVLAYRTYGTMEAIRQNLPDVQATFAKTAEELATWRRVGPRPPHRISGEGEMVYFDSAYASKQIRSNLPLFFEAWTAGAEKLLFFEHGWTDFLVLMLAVLFAFTLKDLWILLAWPIYLISVYSLEGLGTEYRFTLQVIIPCWLIIFKALAAKLPEWNSLRSRAWPRLSPAVLGLIVLLVLARAVFERMNVEKVRSVKVDSVRASSWNSDAAKWTFRVKSSWGLFHTLELDGRQPELAEQLKVQELLPLRYLLDSSFHGERLGLLVPTSRWSLKLNGIYLATIEESRDPSALDQRLSLHFSPWLNFVLPLEASLHWTWSRPCELKMEQLSLFNQDEWSLQTKSFAQHKQWVDRFQPVRGLFTREEELNSAQPPVAEQLCRYLQDEFKADLLRLNLDQDSLEWHVRERIASGSLLGTVDKAPGVTLEASFRKNRFAGLEVRKGFLRLTLEPSVEF